jgi:peroxisomal 2,4-dienoyl-CoA reductase
MENTFKDNFLKGKVALITGGATGICYVIAESYLKYGATVCIMSRKVDVIEKALISLKESLKGAVVYG